MIIFLGKGNKLVIQIVDGEARIVGAIEGDLGLVKREGGWDDLVEFKGVVGLEVERTRLRFDGTAYRRIETKVFEEGAAKKKDGAAGSR